MQSDNEKMLQEIVQNTEMGKNTLDELMGLTHDQKLKDEMLRQKREYRRINQAAHTALDAIRDEATGQSAIWLRCWPKAAARACWTASAPRRITPPPAPGPCSSAMSWATSKARPSRHGEGLCKKEKAFHLGGRWP